jgi:hypothetical protein
MASVIIPPYADQEWRAIYMIYKGIAKGKTIELEEYLPYNQGQMVNVSVEPVEGQLPHGSPESIRRVMQGPPHLETEDVEKLERAISEGKLPMQNRSIFDGAVSE